jgi:predicted RNA-binding protein YlxR (DUF448 family)
LVRLVRTPAATVAFDLQKRLPGRGAWVCLSRECLSKALSPRVLGKTFRAPTTAPEVDLALQDLLDRVAARVAALLETGSRNGMLEAGADAVLRAVADGRVLTLFLATDLAARTLRRFDGIDPSVSVSRFFTMEALGRAIGRPDTGIAGVTNRSLASAISKELARMDKLQQSFRPSGGVPT